jgi:hypothetical protein
MDIEKAKNLLESLAARKIGGAHYIMSSEEVDLAYEAINDYVARNEPQGIDVKLPFVVCLGEVL